MARPSKAEVEKREKIKELGLSVRDNEAYTKLENKLQNISNYFIPYYFCGECCSRNESIADDIFDDIFNYKTDFFLDMYKAVMTEKHRGKIKKLFNLDKDIGNYFGWVYFATLLPIEAQKDSKSYFVYNEVYKGSLEKILPEKTINEYAHYGYIRMETLIDNLTDKQINNIKKHYKNNDFLDTNYKTIIRENHTLMSKQSLTETTHNKSVYVELDFTKPLGELIDFITLIKNDFDEDPTSIQNIYDSLGDGREIFKCDLQNCDIYKSNNIKPLGGRLADVLFIYDCRKAGLDNDYILNEINKYWTETKNLFKDKMQLDTLREYHNLAIDYIDNEKYKCYLSGYNLPQ